jgi:endo-1,3(4)-beta-glucanase
LLLLTEIRSTQTYWHMPSKSTVYPEVFAQNKMVGIIWSTKADYLTWFGDNPVYIHGIQMIPFTPVTEWNLEKEFMTEEYPVIAGAAGYDAVWRSYVISAQAIIDKNGAWQAIQGVSAYHPGTSKTNTLHWIATRPI